MAIKIFTVSQETGWIDFISDLNKDDEIFNPDVKPPHDRYKNTDTRLLLTQDEISNIIFYGPYEAVPHNIRRIGRLNLEVDQKIFVHEPTEDALDPLGFVINFDSSGPSSTKITLFRDRDWTFHIKFWRDFSIEIEELSATFIMDACDEEINETKIYSIDTATKDNLTIFTVNGKEVVKLPCIVTNLLPEDTWYFTPKSVEEVLLNKLFNREWDLSMHPERLMAEEVEKINSKE